MTEWNLESEIEKRKTCIRCLKPEGLCHPNCNGVKMHSVYDMSEVVQKLNDMITQELHKDVELAKKTNEPRVFGRIQALKWARELVSKK